MDSRTSKQNYYLDIADAVLERSTCLRRKYGAIIVRNGWASPPANAMSSAAPCMPRPTPSSPPPAGT